MYAVTKFLILNLEGIIEKYFLLALRLRICRRLKPILGYIFTQSLFIYYPTLWCLEHWSGESTKQEGCEWSFVRYLVIFIRIFCNCLFHLDLCFLFNFLFMWYILWIEIMTNMHVATMGWRFQLQMGERMADNQVRCFIKLSPYLKGRNLFKCFLIGK